MIRVAQEPVGTSPHPKFMKWIDDVKACGAMIVQRTQVGPEINQDGHPRPRCVGYIGVFFVDNVVWDPTNTFTCDLVGKHK
jgi:hypothetical protein